MMYNINLQRLAKEYSISFIRFIQNYNIAITVEEAHYLLDYAISMIYDIECQWYTDSIRMYGAVCISALSNSVQTDCTLYLEDRFSLVQLACSYFVAEIGVTL